MRFDGFYGNEPIKERLSAAAREDKFAHFYLLSGPQGSGRHTLARILIAAMLCTGGGEVPCGVCPQCRKALSGNHPDVILVDDPEKKTVPVDLVRQAREDMFIRPNEGKRKIYVIPRGQDLGLPGQNALLKILEEPPAYGVFLVFTDGPEKLLPTVRSRATELKLEPLSQEVLLPALRQQFPKASDPDLTAAIDEAQGYLGAAQRILQGGGRLPQTLRFGEVYGGRDEVGLLELLVSMEKLKRDKLPEILIQWRRLLSAALVERTRGGSGEIFPARRSGELLKGAEALKQAMVLLQGNGSVGAVCGVLFWELR